MKKVLLFLVLSMLIGHNPASGLKSSDEPHLIIISIDGFPADALDNEDIPLPNIRKLAEDGVRAEAMIPSNPTNTWPNHTTMVTGLSAAHHNLLHNGLLRYDQDQKAFYVDNDTDRGQLIDVPTLYDAAHQEGLQTAEINWPATRGAESLDFSMPDVLYSVEHTTSSLCEALIEAGVLRDEDKDHPFLQRTPPGRDEVWNQAAIHLIEEHQPNLLLHHLLNVDTVHHLHGVDTSAGYTALTLADRHVGELLNALDQAGIREQSTVFIVSDHGFINVDYTLYPNVLLKEHGLLETNDDGEIKNARAQVVATGGTAMVVTTEDSDEDDLTEAAKILEDAEGIAGVIDPDEYEAYGLPQPDESDQIGQLFLKAEPGYGFQNSADEEEYIGEDGRLIGYHGYPNDYSEMQTIFIASGKGIKSGVTIDTIENLFVAPTAAELLEISLDEAESEAVEEILD